MTSLKRGFACAAATILSVLVVAATSSAAGPAKTAEDVDWQAGGGLAIAPEYEGSNDYGLVPIFRARTQWKSGRFFELTGTQSSGAAPRLRANILKKTEASFGPVLQVRRSRRDVSDNFVHRMPSIGPAVELGAFGGVRRGNLGFTLTGAGAVTEYKGWLMELLVDYKRELRKGLSLGVATGSTWASAGYHDTYFGVSAPQSAQSGLATYSPGKGIKDVMGQLSLNWQPARWEHWSFGLAGRYARMVKHADHSSPIVEQGSENQMFGGLMLMYDN
jgi:outer membrane scaffolding protein for murein synthesis (MipA/OmpV family)